MANHGGGSYMPATAQPNVDNGGYGHDYSGRGPGPSGDHGLTLAWWMPRAT